LKINIFYKNIKKPWGGGNQFLDYLKNKFKKNKLYCNHDNADVIIFNSHHNISHLLNLKYKYQDTKKFIHRIDGPISNYRKNGNKIDKFIFIINKYLADATVFQSRYSMKKTLLLTKINNPRKVIYNEANENFFFPKKKRKTQIKDKIKLLSVSWSDNILKGFDFLDYLDKNLDFIKYEMDFIGNSPIKFKNINMYPPLQSKQLAKRMRESDIFIFPSIYEACSNTLLEAMRCGTPVIVNNSSSNKEIFNGNGSLFTRKEQLIEKISKINLSNLKYSRNNLLNILPVEQAYLQFIKKIFKRKKLSFLNYIILKIYVFFLFKK